MIKLTAWTQPFGLNNKTQQTYQWAPKTMEGELDIYTLLQKDVGSITNLQAYSNHYYYSIMMNLN